MTRQQQLARTGQTTCHDTNGSEIPCSNSGHDADCAAGVPWPEPRFILQDERVLDALTDLTWTRSAAVADFPLTWQESLDFIAGMNAEQYQGYGDWRLPNRRELRSLISHQTRRPALPEGHPFTQVFGSWYWSSTTAAPAHDHAWYVNLDGGRMFYGGKDQAFMLWPVRGEANTAIARTGQQHCYTADGQLLACADTAQDGDLKRGVAWPKPRFETTPRGVLDHLTSLRWYACADLARGGVDWDQALAAVTELRRRLDDPGWRLPNINELESLVDCSRHSPALPSPHTFESVRDVYWSSSSSLYEPDWAWALYLDKGAVGVGMKRFARFHVWAVADG